MIDTMMRSHPLFLFLLVLWRSTVNAFTTQTLRRPIDMLRVSPAHTSTAKAEAFSTSSRSAQPKTISKPVAALTKAGMILYILSMCIALPLTLFPQRWIYRLGLIDGPTQNRWALRTGEFCARWLLRLIPFCRVHVSGPVDPDPQPSIWVCNHTSMLDVFVLMATDWKLRGKKKRPIKIVYWKGLDSNPVTKILFQQAGFIPVQMTANKAGEDNDYDKKSFKALVKGVKQAFDEGFDVGILPEGQLNPMPEVSLLPIFTGAYTLAKMSRRPINMMALHGTHRLWHADDSTGMTVTGRDVWIQSYPINRKFSSADEFAETFRKIVGTFATTGKELPPEELKEWITGSAWERLHSKTD